MSVIEEVRVCAVGGPEPSSKLQEGDDSQAAIVVPPIRQVLSAELQVYLEMIQALLQKTRNIPDSEPGGAFHGWPAANGETPHAQSRSILKQAAAW